MESHCGRNYSPITISSIVKTSIKFHTAILHVNVSTNIKTLSLFHQTLYQIPNTTPDIISNTKHITKLYIKYQTQHQTSYQIPSTSPNFISNTKHNTKIHVYQHTLSFINIKHIPKLHIKY